MSLLPTMASRRTSGDVAGSPLNGLIGDRNPNVDGAVCESPTIDLSVIEPAHKSAWSAVRGVCRSDATPMTAMAEKTNASSLRRWLHRRAA